MKLILYVSAIRKDDNIELDKDEIAKLPKKLFLAYSIQYKKLAESVKKQLEREKIKVEKFQQVLGCSKINTSLPMLLVSTGKFHAHNLFLQTPLLYILENNKIIRILESEIKAVKNKKKTALMKFLNAEKIGILVSTKPGQENLKKAEELRYKLEKQGKQAYIFISNNIDINQFENFNIDSWVNIACPGLSLDNSSIINIDELLK